MTTKLALWCDRVIEGGWLMLLITTPAFFNIYSSRVFEPDKMTVLRCIVAVMCTAWAIRTIERARGAQDLLRRARETIGGSIVAISVAVFVGVTVLTTITSIDPGLSVWGSYQRLQGSLNLWSYAAVFFMIVTTLRSRAQVERLITTVLITSLYVSLYGIMQHFKLDPLPWGGDVTDRVTSSLGNPIFLGAYVLMAMPLTLLRLMEAIDPLWNTQPGSGTTDRGGMLKQSLLVAGYTALIGIQGVVLIWTKSRGPWMGGAVALAFFILVVLLRRRRYALSAAIAVVGTAFLVFVVLLNLPSGPISSLRQASPYLSRLGTALDFEEGTNRVRLLIWRGDDVGGGAIGLILASPLRTIVGYGPESMYLAYNPYYPPDLAHFEARNASPDRSHNDPLDFLVTMGALGLASFFAVLGTALVAGLRFAWRVEEKWWQLAAIAFMAGNVGHVFEAFVGIAIAATRTHFFVFAAVIAALPAMRYLLDATRAGARIEAAPGMQAFAMAPVVVATGRAQQRGQAGRSPVALAERPPKRRNGKRGSGRSRASVGDGVRAGEAAVATRPLDVGQVCALSYAAVTTVLLFLLFLSTARGSDLARWVTENPKSALVLLIAWIGIGIVALAAWATRTERPAIGLKSHWLPIYGPLVLAALIAILGVFLPNVEADVQYKLGFGYDSAQRWDRAVTSYLKAVDIQPNQDYYFLFLGRAYLELARRAPVRPGLPNPQTLADLKKLGLDQPRPERSSQEQLFNAALVALLRARDLAPLNTDHSANLGRLYRFWGEATTQDPELRTQRFQKAAQYQEHAVELSPNLAHLHAERAFTFSLLGNYAEAEKNFARAAELDPAFATTFLQWGDVLLNQQRLDEAVEQYKRALAIDGRIVQAHSALGFIYTRQGKLVEALQENLVAAEIAPQDFATRRNLAFLYADLGQIGPAVQQAQLALQLAPPDQKPQMEQLINQLQQRAAPGR